MNGPDKECQICGGFGEYVVWNNESYHCTPDNMEWFSGMDSEYEKRECSCVQNARLEPEEPLAWSIEKKLKIKVDEAWNIEDSVRLRMMSYTLKTWEYRIPELVEARKHIDLALKRVRASIEHLVHWEG